MSSSPGRSFSIGGRDPAVPLPRTQAPIPLAPPAATRAPPPPPARPRAAVVIEHDVQMPPKGKGNGNGRPPKYPFATMGVGDSFFLAGESTRLLSGSASGAGKRYGMKFKLRTMDGGVRCWRIA